MALQTTTNISVDFYDNKYIMINAKQYDDNSRWIAVACYNKGDLLNLSANKHNAYIRYRKADGYGVLNTCRINYRGEVLVELTEQMLAADGICYVDLIIVNKGDAIVNVDTGEIITIDDSSVLSTMAFCVNVYEAAFDNSMVESSYEFDALNSALKKAEADYAEVMQLSKSYAVGDAMGIRSNEDFDNSKYYSRMSKSYAMGDAGGIREGEDVDNSKYYRQKALESAEEADISKTNAAESANSAIDSAESASESAKSASESATSASESAAAALESEDIIRNYATVAESNVNAVLSNAQIASESATNAYNYYLQVEEITNGLGGAFNPKGTVAFAELAILLANGEVEAGDLYNISDNFTTDETFKKGAGIDYAVGTNVYYTSEGYWDCLSGTGVVIGVKGDKESEYRKGNINLTADNIGAISDDDIVGVDELKDYLKVYVDDFGGYDNVISLKADVDNLSAEVDDVQSDIGDLQTNIGTIQSDINGLKTDIGDLKTNDSIIQNDISGLKKDVAYLMEEVKRLLMWLPTYMTCPKCGGNHLVSNDEETTHCDKCEKDSHWLICSDCSTTFCYYCGHYHEWVEKEYPSYDDNGHNYKFTCSCGNVIEGYEEHKHDELSGLCVCGHLKNNDNPDDGGDDEGECNPDEHDWSNKDGICASCEYECTHEDTQFLEYSYLNDDGEEDSSNHYCVTECKTCGMIMRESMPHSYENNSCICDDCGYGEHTPNRDSADCSNDVVCEHCGTVLEYAYGFKDENGDGYCDDCGDPEDLHGCIGFVDGGNGLCMRCDREEKDH